MGHLGLRLVSLRVAIVAVQPPCCDLGCLLVAVPAFGCSAYGGPVVCQPARSGLGSLLAGVRWAG